MPLQNNDQMPTIQHIDGVKFVVHNGEHRLPHIHAIYSEFEVLIEIEHSFKLIKLEEPGTNKKMDYSHIISRLTLLMESEHPYFDPVINLLRLSNLMKTKPEIISEVLNASLNQNFFDFIQRSHKSGTPFSLKRNLKYIKSNFKKCKPK